MRRIPVGAIVFMALVLSEGSLQYAADNDARKLAPWLSIPAGWACGVENGVITAVPGDLRSGSTLVLLIEPITSSQDTIAQDYERALNDLAPWTPAGDPVQQQFETGWIFRLGVGVAHIDGADYTAQTTVARKGQQLTRFWAIADSDATFNRYKEAVALAITSVQTLTDPAQTTARADDLQGACRRVFHGTLC